MTRPYLSIIIPFFNEHGNIAVLHKELAAVSTSLNKRVELIYVDDGSNDGSLNVLHDAIKTQKFKGAVQIISFTRNFGQTAAMMAGIEHAQGQYLAFLDGDGQNDPKDIPVLLHCVERGHDAVFGWRKFRNDTFFRALFSQAGNWIVRRALRVPLHDVGCTVRVCSAELFTDLKLYGEAHRLMSVMLYRRSTRCAEVLVNHRSRKTGRSKYNYTRVFKLLSDITTVELKTTYAMRPGYFFLLPVILSHVIAISFFVAQGVFGGVFWLAGVMCVLAGVHWVLLGSVAEQQLAASLHGQVKKTYQVRRIIHP